VQLGVSREYALPLVREMLLKPKVIAGHNIEFDMFMLRVELARAGYGPEDDPFEGASLFCTMQSTTDICCIPGPYGNKWPKLQEAYEFIFGRQFDDAHDALADVRACSEIYWWLKGRDKKANNEQTVQ